jgi:DNA-binding transcriptional regulator YiaG
MDRDQILARGKNRRRWTSQPPDLARLVREQAGLTQAEMADVLNVGRSALARWELGQRVPRPAVLDRYLKLLDRLRHQR